MNQINKVLITGIGGFVGSHLADYILAKFPNIEVLGLIRWWEPKENIKHISAKIKLCYGDLVDMPSLETILREHRPEVIFHLAAQSYVDFSFLAPITTLEANAIGTANLLETVKKLKLNLGYDPIVQIASSSECYGQVKENEVPIKEENPFRPASPYAVSKVTEDMLAFQYWLSWKIKTIRTRMFTHTGPRRGEVFVESNFAKQNIEVKVDPARLRPSDVTLQIPCIDKFVKETGWKPEIKFEKTLEDILNYWRDYFKKEKQYV